MNTCTSTTNFDDSVFSISRLKESLEAIDKLIKDEPFAKLMKENGFDHEKGDILYIPHILAEQFNSLPSYVRTSKLIDAPVCIKQSLYNVGMIYDPKY